ncbi:MAG: GspE/PulE family protein [Candidatus Omnitrophota bacterium]
MKDDSIPEINPGREREDSVLGVPDEGRVIQLVNKILNDSIEQRASDVLIEPLEKELQIRFRIDGLLVKNLVLPKDLQDKVVSRIKVMSNLDISEHRLPQDGRFKTSNIKNREVDFRVSIVPCTEGEKVVLRILDKTTATLEIDKLGLSAAVVEAFKRNLAKPFGMILVCGPTGSGKTTTLYSALKHIDSVERNIITVEDPVEYQLFGINQVNVSEDIGLTFSRVLRSILRQDPDIILVGEIRDFETADISIKAALTGHLLLSTLHTISAVGSIVRLINMGVEPFLIASSCLLVVSQVLARRLCSDCKEADPVNQEKINELKSYGMTFEPGDTIYRPKGCALCNNTGFRGRFALSEGLEITPQIKELIIAAAPEKEIFDVAVKEGMMTLREGGAFFVQGGITSVDEILRVTSF